MRKTIDDMQAEINDTAEQRRILRERGICVVIPTYDNAATVVDVVTRARVQCDDVIVVCDGCSDGTERLVRAVEGITVVAYKENKGKGEALKQGFCKALEMGFSYAITIDADGQHFPEDIHVFLDANIKHPGALIVGARKGLEKAERSKGSKFANAFGNFWFCVQTGRCLKDTQTGYRLYPLRKIRGLGLLTSRYEAELELMVFLCWHGVSIVSVEVDVYYPPKEERVSHFRPGKDFTRIFVLNTCLCFLALLYGLPLKLFRTLMIFLRTTYSLLFYLLSCFLILIPYTCVVNLLWRDAERKSSLLHGLLYCMTKFVIRQHGIPGVRYEVHAGGETFEKPAVIICNHQSHLDLMIMLSQTRKVVMLTNDWVWHSPFFGLVIRNAEYYPVSMGMEAIMPKLKSLVERGYSIALYPEGTRSQDCSIGRFHKGAFHIARMLQTDILPLVEYGVGRVLPKGGKYLRKGQIVVQMNRRVTFEEYDKIGSDQQLASWFRQYYRREYSSMCNRYDRDA